MRAENYINSLPDMLDYAENNQDVSLERVLDDNGNVNGERMVDNSSGQVLAERSMDITDGEVTSAQDTIFEYNDDQSVSAETKLSYDSSSEPTQSVVTEYTDRGEKYEETTREYGNGQVISDTREIFGNLGSDSPTEQIRTTYDESGNVDRIEVERELIPQNVETQTGPTVLIDVKEYDQDGNVTKHTEEFRTSSQGVDSSVIREFDEKDIVTGRIEESGFYTNEGYRVDRTEYDSHGQETARSSISYEPDGTTTREYREDGSLEKETIETQSYDSDLEKMLPGQTITREYDEDGNVKEMTIEDREYDDEGNLDQTVTERYDAEERLEMRTIVEESGEVTIERREYSEEDGTERITTEKYDAEGNLDTITRSSEAESTLEDKIEYYKDGALDKVVVKTSEYDAQDRIESRTVTEYDKDGNMERIKEETYDTDGQMKSQMIIDGTDDPKDLEGINDVDADENEIDADQYEDDYVDYDPVD